MAAIMTLCSSSAVSSQLVSEEGISPGHSAEFVRTQSRNASLDPDSVFYNPAGLPFMQNGGIFILLNSLNTYVQKKSSVNRLWGYQGINASNNASMALTSMYQSPLMFFSTMMVAMPSDFSLVFKRDNWSVFCTLSTLHGQPGATYTQSAAFLDRMLVAYNSVLSSLLSQQLINVYSTSYLKRTEVHIGATAGGAYAITDRISTSLAFRYVNIQSETTLGQTPYAVELTNGIQAENLQYPTRISTTVRGQGMGIIAGLDFKPLDNLNIGMKVEYYPPLILTKRTRGFIANPVLAQTGLLNLFCDSVWPLIINDRINPNGLGNIFNMLTMDPRTVKNIGNTYKATYPPSLSLGISYRIIPSVGIGLSADLTFPRARDLDGRERDWSPVGYRLGQSIEWNATGWLTVSGGYSYHDFGLRRGRVTEYDDLLTSHTLGAGCTLKPVDLLDVTIASSYTFYAPFKNNNYDALTSTILGNRVAYGQAWRQHVTRNEWCVSLGATFSIYPISVDHKKKAEEHYWKGMSDYLRSDIDSALEEFKTAKSHNAYYKDIDRKIRDLTELRKIIKKNRDDEKTEKGKAPDDGERTDDRTDK